MIIESLPRSPISGVSITQPALIAALDIFSRSLRGHQISASGFSLKALGTLPFSQPYWSSLLQSPYWWMATPPGFSLGRALARIASIFSTLLWQSTPNDQNTSKTPSESSPNELSVTWWQINRPLYFEGSSHLLTSM